MVAVLAMAAMVCGCVTHRGGAVRENPGADEASLADAGTEESAGSGGFDTVLLEDAVADFRHIADNIASHSSYVIFRGADEDVYPQPYCYLTTRLVQMHAAGWREMDIDTLAAVSGASAMFGYQAGEFMPKYAFHHRDPNSLVAQTTGYATETVRIADAEKGWLFVKESIDSGRPVTGWHAEMMLLAGYRDAVSASDRQVFAMKDGNEYFAKWLSWRALSEWVGSDDLSRFAGRVEPESPEGVALRVLRDLVALSAGVPEHIQQAFPKATFGLEGIAAWATDCADVETHPDWRMCHPENPQWTVRNSTAAYLQHLAEAETFPTDVTEHIRRASEKYRAAYQSWQRAYGLIGYGAPDGSGKVKEKRLAAAQAVREALEHERSAIAQIEEALLHVAKPNP